MNKLIQGLSTQEVQQQQELGNVNVVPKTKTKSSFSIILSHTFNLFNFYNFAIAFMLILVKEYFSVFFLNIIVMNIGIRSFQEIRAKRIVENLNILISKDIRVIRDGESVLIPAEELVLGDVVVYRIGDQVAADSQVIMNNVEMNESNITGESEPIMKNPQDVLLSGSFVTSGMCYAKTIRVGIDSYAQNITEQARQFEPVESELMNAFVTITKWCARLVLPIGLILAYQSMAIRGEDFRTMVVNTSTVLLALLPKGIVLLTHLSFGVSVFRLAQKRTLVQEIYSVEVLSKVDVLFIDKTGTLTQGNMTVEDIVYVDDKQEALNLLSRYISHSNDTDSTTQAMKAYLPYMEHEGPQHIMPFSSLRKWGSMYFEDRGTVYLGAPEFLIPDYTVSEEALKYQSEGARVLVMAYSSEKAIDSVVPKDLHVSCFIAISDPIRDDVKESLEFFKDNQVLVKVISGDNINTLMAVASKTGIVDGDKAIDISQTHDDEGLLHAVMNYNVIGRASPHQKQRMVQLLQAQKQRVAMVGDGVNDVLALRSADCSIAMGAGSSAARQAAQIILLDNEFTTMVDVVMEGRLVTNNISRSASMYYLGTLMTFLLSIVAIAMNTPFPFIPLQISVKNMFVEGMPSSFVTFESNTNKPTESILSRITRFTFPPAATIAVLFIIVGLMPISIQLKQTYMYFISVYVAFGLVMVLFQPMNFVRVLVLLIASAGFLAVCYFFYNILYLARLTQAEVMTVGILFVVSSVVYTVLGFLISKLLKNDKIQRFLA